jgi:hypothetical protein
MQTPGVPDLFVMHPMWGLSLWVEVKRPGGKLTEAQRGWHEIAKRSGLHVTTAYCSSDVMKELRDLGAPLNI